jgi:hypothetical protein
VLGAIATGAAAVLCAGWAGAAFGRGVSMLRDGTRTRFNQFSTVFEVVVSLAIGAPWFFWMLGVGA